MIKACYSSLDDLPHFNAGIIQQSAQENEGSLKTPVKSCLAPATKYMSKSLPSSPLDPINRFVSALQNLNSNTGNLSASVNNAQLFDQIARMVPLI